MWARTNMRVSHCLYLAHYPEQLNFTNRRGLDQVWLGGRHLVSLLTFKNRKSQCSCTHPMSRVRENLWTSMSTSLTKLSPVSCRQVIKCPYIPPHDRRPAMGRLARSPHHRPRS